MSNWKKALMSGALLMALGGPIFANEGDGNRSAGRGMMMDRSGMGGPMMDFYGSDSILDRIDGRLAFLKTELKITEEQTPAWDELAAVIRTNVEKHNLLMQDMMKEFHSGDFSKKPLPDQLSSQQAHLEARLEQVKTTKAAVEKLYGMLSDEQKQSADEIVLPMSGMGMGRMRGMGPGMMSR